MKKILFASLVSALLSHTTIAALQEGRSAPDFKAEASLAGKPFQYSLQDALKKGPVVVYFYPSAFTGGCNIQAHTFASKSEQFSQAGASVIGVSLDSIDRLNAFSADPAYCAGKLAVASDIDGNIAKAYELTVKAAAPDKKDSRGVPITHGFAERTTFIVSQDGKIAATIGGLKPAENVEQALGAVQKLAAARTSSSQ
jgi:thioredoxin-dependent peroxiredoxin